MCAQTFHNHANYIPSKDVFSNAERSFLASSIKVLALVRSSLLLSIIFYSVSGFMHHVKQGCRQWRGGYLTKL